MRDSTSYADPGLKMWDTFALATVLTLKSDPERPPFKGPAQSVQSQVSTDLGYCRKFNPFYNLNYSAWERAPWCRVTEKSHFSTLNVGLAGTGNQTRATCVAGSTRRLAIHYAFFMAIYSVCHFYFNDTESNKLSAQKWIFREMQMMRLIKILAMLNYMSWAS
jgi:hypothetical protein